MSTPRKSYRNPRITNGGHKAVTGRGTGREREPIIDPEVMKDKFKEFFDKWGEKSSDIKGFNFGNRKSKKKE